MNDHHRASRTSIDNDVPEHIINELRDVIVHARAAAVHPLDVRKQEAPRVQAFSAALATAQQARQPWTLVPWFLGAGFVIAGLLLVSQYGMKVKGRVVKEGNAAISSLLLAKDSAAVLDFAGARQNLAASAKEFQGASKELNALGPSIVGLISHIPGLSSLKSGHNALTAGALFSDAGLAMSDAMDSFMKFGTLLQSGDAQQDSARSLMVSLRQSLERAQGDIDTASKLINALDISSLPEEYQTQLRELKVKLPDLTSLISQSSEFVAFFERATGSEHPQRYLVLFTNSSELRPTGGFPGSYGLLTFEHNRLKDFHADDIYNPDGQLKTLIVPPVQLQHITPGWGMRDSAWWIDFPTSARKAMEFWRLDGGAAVDGVLSIKPEVLKGILEITGPLSMPNYDLVLTATNVIEQLQLEVESKKTSQPKQVIVDAAPLILERLAKATPSQWAALIELLATSIRERDVMAYFDDPKLQDYSVAHAMSGSILATGGDYLMVNISNIKGAKSDAVTNTNVKLESWMESGTLVHRLTLTRRHNGGDTDYGFYNKTNTSYVRVLVPGGSMLRDITGNAKPLYVPLLTYTDAMAVRDKDLVALESTYRTDARGVTLYEEAGKAGFGFWMVLQPGMTESVQIEYVIPARVAATNYSLLVQRQPGLDVSDFEFTLQKSPTLTVTASKPTLTVWPDSWRLHDDLKQDLEITAVLR